MKGSATRRPIGAGRWLLCALALAFAWRAWGLGRSSLWLDEIGQAGAAQAPWDQLADKVGQHLSPPLDYAVTKLALAWGHSESVLRAPALFFSLLSLPLFFALAARLAPGSAGWALWLLALSPLALQYAREGRMYALFLFLSLASWLGSLRFRERPSLAAALAWGGVGGLALLTHYFAVFALLGQAVAAAWDLRRSSARTWAWLAAAVAVMGLVFAPWTPWALAQWRHAGGGMAYGLRPDLSFFKQALSAFSSASGFRDPWFYAFALAALGGAGLAWKRGERGLIEVALLLAFSLLALWALSLARPMVTVRNMIYLLPAYLLLAARSVRWLQTKAKLSTALVALVLGLLMAPALQARRVGREAYQPDWRGAAQAIQALDPQGQQTVWVPDTHSRACLAWYLTPEADTVFMHARSLDARNLGVDRIRIVSGGDVRTWQQGRLDGLFLEVRQPLGAVAAPVRLNGPTLWTSFQPGSSESTLLLRESVPLGSSLKAAP